ncbi:lymphotoxin-alpha-like [Spinachia spinachia]
MEDEREQGLHQDVLIQLLGRNETRHRRMTRLLGLALLLLTGALALLAAVVFGGQSSESQPMIHHPPYLPGLSLQQQPDSSNPSAMLTIPNGNKVNGNYLEWENASGRAFCRGGFTHFEGSLVVPRTGIYRVFLQVTYERNHSISCDEELTLRNSVFYFHDNYKKDKDILTSVDMVNNQKQWVKTLYTAGLFELHTGGWLRVNTSHPKLIVDRESRVFFGAELLPQ